MSEDMFFDRRLNAPLLDGHHEMTPLFETGQSGSRNGGRGELGIAVELQGVVLRVQDQRRRPYRGDSVKVRNSEGKVGWTDRTDDFSGKSRYE